MRRVFKSTSVLFAAIGLLTVGSVSASAQEASPVSPDGGEGGKAPLFEGSGTRAEGPPGGSGTQQKGSPIALEGFCAVSILEMHKWVKGDPAHRVVYDGRAYLFPNEQAKRMFEENPAKYVPALGGDCAVALVKKGKRVPGNIRHASIHDGRLFLFSNADAHKMFRAEPAAYANADLALGGHCPVCRVNLGKDVPGKPEIAAFHKGLRYLFPAEKQRQAFLANPQKYVSESGSGTR